MRKTVDALVTASYSLGNAESRGWRMEIKDELSRRTIAIVEVNESHFLEMMSSVAATPASCEVFDSFDNFGKRRELKQVTLTDERLKKSCRDSGFAGVVGFWRYEHEKDGWRMICPNPNSLSQGQHNMTKGTLIVTMERFVESKP